MFTKKWLDSRMEHVLRIGWVERKDIRFFWNAADEYKAMLIALSKDCPLKEVAFVLGLSWETLRRDREILGILGVHGGPRRKRMYWFCGESLSCDDIAIRTGTNYNTAYARLNRKNNGRKQA